MKNFKFNRFLPITKIDDEERMVYGYASTPDLDSDGEVIKIDAMERALPQYLKFPTIREMHQPKAIGTTKSAEIDSKGMYIGAKIVADDAWKLVKEGVYKAFSIGGNVVKRVGNVIQELDLVEISLVDVPANKSAMIEVWKADGMTKSAELQYIEILKDMDFADNKIADTIREGVISAMKKSMTKNEEVAETVVETVVEATEPETLEAEPTVETEGESPTDTEIVEAVVEDESEEVEETEDEESADDKLAMANQTLEKLAGADVQKKLNLAKTVTNIASTVAKMASQMEESMRKMDERITGLENTPAQLKSKSVLVLKNAEAVEDEVEKTQNTDLEAKKARLDELTKIFNEIGASAFAKQGFSLEAGKLQSEVEKLATK